MLINQATARSVSIDLDDAGAPAHLALAHTLEALGRGLEAAAAFEAAATSDPHSLDAQLGFARVLMILGRTRDAFAQADAALALDAESVAAWTLIADALAALGETGFAAQACARAVQLAPDAADIRVRWGQLLEAIEQPLEAAAAYVSALALNPSLKARVEAHVSLSALHGRAGQFMQARKYAEAALALAPDHQGGWQNLAAICDHEGLVEIAEASRERAYRGRALIVERSTHPRLRVLTLASAQCANSPVRHLIPGARYDRLSWFLGYDDAKPKVEYDVVFNAVADADLSRAIAPRLAAFTQSCGRRVLNPPERIALTARDAAPSLYADVPGLRVPTVRKVSQVQDISGLASGEWLLRPLGAHGGQGLERLTLDAIAQRLDGAPHYLTRYHDFRSPDGLYRKYRIFFVDRKPYAYHLAIHDHWNVHYQSSLTPTRTQYLDEERRFLENPRAALGALAYDAVAEVGRRMDLDFAGADFGVSPDGRALLFEANATMLVHEMAPDSPLAFKNPFVRRILEAFWAMLEGR